MDAQGLTKPPVPRAARLREPSDGKGTLLLLLAIVLVGLMVSGFVGVIVSR